MKRHLLTERFTVDLPPSEAFVLFTPRGEEAWAAGWKPSFPAPAPDDTAPGTVFESNAHGDSVTWIVLDREPGQRISYARFTPGRIAGTVTVALSPRDGASDVQVTYDLTALNTGAAAELDEFAAAYPAYIGSWRTAIAESL